MYFFFFNDTATTEIYTLSLHDALPISLNCSRLPCVYAQETLTFLLTQKKTCVSKNVSVRSEERFSRNAETDLVCRLLLEKKKTPVGGHPRSLKSDTQRPTEREL